MAENYSGSRSQSLDDDIFDKSLDFNVSGLLQADDYTQEVGFLPPSGDKADTLVSYDLKQQDEEEIPGNLLANTEFLVEEDFKEELATIDGDALTQMLFVQEKFLEEVKQWLSDSLEDSVQEQKSLRLERGKLNKEEEETNSGKQNQLHTERQKAEKNLNKRKEIRKATHKKLHTQIEQLEAEIKHRETTVRDAVNLNEDEIGWLKKNPHTIESDLYRMNKERENGQGKAELHLRRIKFAPSFGDGEDELLEHIHKHYHRHSHKHSHKHIYHNTVPENKKGMIDTHDVQNRVSVACAHLGDDPDTKVEYKSFHPKSKDGTDKQFFH